MQIELVPLIVALIGVGGLGAFFREIVAGVTKIAGGMSARESKRKVDIVQQRDEANARAESSDRKRRKALELTAFYRRRLIENGIEPGEDDDWAYVQRTQTTRLPEPPNKEKE